MSPHGVAIKQLLELYISPGYPFDVVFALIYQINGSECSYHSTRGLTLNAAGVRLVDHKTLPYEEIARVDVLSSVRVSY